MNAIPIRPLRAVLATFPLILGFYWFCVTYSVNFPYYDDFEALTKFVYDFHTHSSLLKRVSLLFAQNFEHRVVLLKSVALVHYFVTGSLNFKALILVGNLSLLGCWLVFFLYYTKGQLPLSALVIVTGLLFQIQHYEDTVIWATCALQHAPCLFMTLVAVYAALQGRGWTGLLAGALAMFSSANGIITPLLVIATLGWMGRPRQAAWGGALFVALLALHITFFTSHSGNLFANGFSYVPAKVLLWLAFAGQLIKHVTSDLYTQAVLGLLFLSPLLRMGYLFLNGRAAQISDLQWLCLMGLTAVAFTGFLIVFVRTPTPDGIGMQMDRYNVYASFFAVFASVYYLSLIRTHGERAAGWVLAVVTLLFAVSTYFYYYEKVVDYRKVIMANQINWRWGQVIYYPHVSNSSSLYPYFQEMEQKRIISFYGPITPLVGVYRMGALPDSLPVRLWSDGQEVLIQNQTLTLTGSSANDGVYIALAPAQSATFRYLFPAQHQYQPARRVFLTRFYKPVAPGFQAQFFLKKLIPGPYDVYALVVEHDKLSRLFKVGSVRTPVDQQAKVALNQDRKAQ
jgi:hypothetical protein